MNSCFLFNGKKAFCLTNDVLILGWLSTERKKKEKKKPLILTSEIIQKWTQWIMNLKVNREQSNFKKKTEEKHPALRLWDITSKAQPIINNDKSGFI